MMPAVQDRPQTVLDLLFTPGEDSPEVLAHQIISADVTGDLGRTLANLPKSLREATVGEATTAAAGMLDVSLTGFLVAGWREHHDVIAAAHRTVAAPGSVELIDVAAHQITVTQRPAVSLLVDGHQVATVQFGLSVVFDISALVAGIRAGRLVALHSGRCNVTATLAIQETNVITRQAHLELPGVIPLGPGIRLLAADCYSPGPAEPESTEYGPAQQAASASDDTIWLAPIK